MAKGILSFNLPEEESEFKTAQQGGDCKCALESIANDIFRKRLKYGEFPEDQRKLIQEMSDEFWETLRQYGIDPYEP